MARIRHTNSKVSPSHTPAKTRSRKTRPLLSPHGTPTARSVPSTPSASRLLSHSQDTSNEWYRSPRTKKSYAGYVKSGKKWLEEWVADGRLDDGGGTLGGETDERLRFAAAFDALSAQTPTALCLLTAYKCDHCGCGFPTAEGLRSAFKQYFEQVLHCQGEFWKFNSHTNEWEGNPVFDSDYKIYFESLKNRENRTGVSNQALPMLPKDMKVIMDYLDGDEALADLTTTRHLYFRAFATTAFCLWTRNDELINLTWKDIRIMSQAGQPYIEFKLIFRKTNKDPTKGQVYQIPPDPDRPEIDCYTHMLAWLTHLQEDMRRPLEADDFIFPAIASTDDLKFGEPTTRSNFESMMDDIIRRSGAMAGRNGRFTTHCFRRGGAQYRFMWASRKWSLKAVKWWGGWSSSENVGTIMRYLLDELMTYEEGFSDIMMENRSAERHESFMGGKDPLAAVSRDDLRVFEQNLLLRVGDLLRPILNGSPARLCNLAPQLHSPCSETPGNDLIPPQQCSSDATPAADFPPPDTPDPVEMTLPFKPFPLHAPTRIPETNTIHDVIQYWEHGAPEKGLLIPLQKWHEDFEPRQYRTQAQKLSMIEKVYQEFDIYCDRDWDIFREQFPGLENCYTKLVAAVRQARLSRGLTKPRRRKRKALATQT